MGDGRLRDDLEETKEELRALGGNIILSESEFDGLLSKSKTQGSQWDSFLKQHFGKPVKRPRLAFNGVGGTSALNLVKSLGPSSLLLTYGGMSLRPVTLPTSMFIFKDLRAQGFWLSEWNKRHPLEGAGQPMSHERVEMIAELLDLMETKRFHMTGSRKSLSQERVPLSGFLDRLQQMEGKGKDRSKKLLIWNDLP